MKKIVLAFITVFVLALFLSFKIVSSGGILDTTGSPGEGTCSGCHSGGAAPTTVSITAVPAFTNNAYELSTNYTISITVSNASLNAFGFDCEILNASNQNSGILSLPGTGVQLLDGFTGRKNALHTTPKAGVGTATFTFKWLSPAFGNTTIYAVGNAVDLGGGTGGDAVGTAVLTLTNVNTAVKENNASKISNISISPNPSSDITSVSYNLNSTQNISIELLDITGKLVKSFFSGIQEAGPHTNIFDLKGINKGVYFMKVSSEGNKLTQKLISVQ